MLHVTISFITGVNVGIELNEVEEGKTALVVDLFILRFFFEWS